MPERQRKFLLHGGKVRPGGLVVISSWISSRRVGNDRPCQRKLAYGRARVARINCPGAEFLAGIGAHRPSEGAAVRYVPDTAEMRSAPVLVTM